MNRDWRISLARAVVVALLLVIVLLPIYWMVAASFKSNKEITQDATLYPHVWTFQNYVHLFSEKEFGHYLINSLGVTIISVILALIAGSLGAYAIARFHLKYRLERKVSSERPTLRSKRYFR